MWKTEDDVDTVGDAEHNGNSQAAMLFDANPSLEADSDHDDDDNVDGGVLVAPPAPAGVR